MLLRCRIFVGLVGLALLCCVLPGCRSRRPEPVGVDWSADWSAQVEPIRQAAKPKRKRDRDDDPVRDRLDDLWRQGYGYNNPNAERLKNGEQTEPFSPPSPFDDDEDDRRRRPHDRQYDPLYNEQLRGLSGHAW